MKIKKIIALILLASIMMTTLCACGRPTLKELLDKEPMALKVLYNSQGPNDIVIKCKDYIVYSNDGGVDEAMDATRFSHGLEVTNDRFVQYDYVVQDRKTGWKYIFENLNDIPIWANRG